MSYTLSRKWSYGICETCSKNSHKIVKMIKEKLSSDTKEVEHWVCPMCGATKLV